MTSRVRFENGDGNITWTMQIPATLFSLSGPGCGYSGDLREVVLALRLRVPSPVVRAKRQETNNDKSQR